MYGHPLPAEVVWIPDHNSRTANLNSNDRVAPARVMECKRWLNSEEKRGREKTRTQRENESREKMTGRDGGKEGETGAQGPDAERRAAV